MNNVVCFLIETMLRLLGAFLSYIIYRLKFLSQKCYCFIFMLRKGVLLLTSSIVLQTNNSYFVKHSLVEKTKSYLLFVTLMFQVKTNQRQFNAGKIFIVEILICKSFVIKQIFSSQITILLNKIHGHLSSMKSYY